MVWISAKGICLGLGLWLSHGSVLRLRGIRAARGDGDGLWLAVSGTSCHPPKVNRPLPFPAHAWGWGQGAGGWGTVGFGSGAGTETGADWDGTPRLDSVPLSPEAGSSLLVRCRDFCQLSFGMQHDERLFRHPVDKDRVDRSELMPGGVLCRYGTSSPPSVLTVDSRQTAGGALVASPPPPPGCIGQKVPMQQVLAVSHTHLHRLFLPGCL